MSKKLLLWDIDGTLITTGGAGEQALIEASKQIYHREFPLSDVDYSGRTDAIIARMIIRLLKEPETDEAIQCFLQAYLYHLEQQLPQKPGKVMPGIPEILRRCSQNSDIVMGLLTGNHPKGAELKLSHYHLWDFFPFGAFSSDSENRNDLAAIAVRRAEEKYSCTFDPENIFVIGDTPHDIECGKMIGAKTIIVAMGYHSFELLRSHNPTVLFKDFSEPERFFEVLEETPV